MIEGVWSVTIVRAQLSRCMATSSFMPMLQHQDEFWQTVVVSCNLQHATQMAWGSMRRRVSSSSIERRSSVDLPALVHVAACWHSSTHSTVDTYARGATLNSLSSPFFSLYVGKAQGICRTAAGVCEGWEAGAPGFVHSLATVLTQMKFLTRCTKPTQKGKLV